MKKVLIFCLVLLGTLLTSCTGEKEFDYELISDDIPAAKYVGNSFAIIEDLNTFEIFFPDYKDEEELRYINEDTFSDYTFIYFEHFSARGVSMNSTRLDEVYFESNTLVFTISEGEPILDWMYCDSMYYLIQIENKSKIEKCEKNIIIRD